MDLKKTSIDLIKDDNLEGIRWEPYSLYVNKLGYYACELATGYVPSDFIIKEINKVKGILKNFNVYIITDNEKFISELNEICCNNNFNLLFINENKVVNLIRPEDFENINLPLRNQEIYEYKIPRYIINKLTELENIDNNYQEILKNFSREYLMYGPDLNREKNLIGDTLHNLLENTEMSNAISAFDNLRVFESLIGKSNRDHYFHSFQIFLLGIIIIDKLYSIFVECYKKIFPNSQSFSIELVWLLTSVFHDIGYPAQNIGSVVNEIINVEDELNDVTELIDEHIWEDMRYNQNVIQFISLFHYLLRNENNTTDWCGEIYNTKPEKDSLYKIIRQNCKRGHGLYSAFIFLVLVYDQIGNITNIDQRNFITKHIYLAAISISLHDIGFRNSLEEKHIKNINISRFPFAGLLMYLDSLQEDRRNNENDIDYQDTIIDISVDNNEVKANLNLEYIVKKNKVAKMKLECKSIIDFLNFDSFKLIYPDWISENK